MAQLIKDLYPGSASSEPEGFTVLNDKVYFAVTDGQHRREFWQLVNMVFLGF